MQQARPRSVGKGLQRDFWTYHARVRVGAASPDSLVRIGWLAGSYAEWREGSPTPTQAAAPGRTRF